MTACPSCGAHVVEDYGELVKFTCGELGRTGVAEAVAGKCPYFGRRRVGAGEHVWGDGSVRRGPEPPISYKESVERRFGMLEFAKIGEVTL